MRMTTKQIEDLEVEAERNSGKCSNCNQTIKIYRYKISKVHCTFLRAMASAVRDTGVNDVDISTIGVAYSVRSQVTKIRQHGLIARVKDERGVQLPRRWLITTKGWSFLNGTPIQEKVTIYNNQVLGHEGNYYNIHQILGEKFDSHKPIYTEAPVSEPEARVYDGARQPKRHTAIKALFRGRSSISHYQAGETYELIIQHLQINKPVTILAPIEFSYKDLATFQKDWRIL